MLAYTQTKRHRSTDRNTWHPYQEGWFSSRVVSVLNSDAKGPGFKSQPRRCRVTVLGKSVHTHRASVHQAAKLVAALLRVARITAGLAESKGSLPPGLWLTSAAGWLPTTGISSGTLRSAIEYGLPFTYRERSNWKLSSRPEIASSQAPYAHACTFGAARADGRTTRKYNASGPIYRIGEGIKYCS